ncbi:MAG: hypothetical protein ABL993_15260 [Vicinamibacterales bacterium]
MADLSLAGAVVLVVAGGIAILGIIGYLINLSAARHERARAGRA